MRVVVQRCDNANVKINNKINGEINKGYMLLVGFDKDDTKEDIIKMAKKIIDLRIFTDSNDKMNLSIKDVNGSILSISQFTLSAKLSGRRPSFSNAMNFNDAKDMYDMFNKELRTYDVKVEEGIFGAEMKVSLINDGPVTILIDSKIDF